ncbi:hypothetical protein DS909_07565 [Phaeobacter gallaeciensis]|uniref:Uncharacterized protein n=1 Tax=Phaeobacter gallaeciensis TaxID=60890 RepID=A0A366X4Q2_9RHOB|nr:hypothetical protein DS909_07565 [Phaeobacter gallaeciensis]
MAVAPGIDFYGIHGHVFAAFLEPVLSGQGVRSQRGPLLAGASSSLGDIGSAGECGFCLLEHFDLLLFCTGGGSV